MHKTELHIESVRNGFVVRNLVNDAGAMIFETPQEAMEHIKKWLEQPIPMATLGGFVSQAGATTGDPTKDLVPEPKMDRT